MISASVDKPANVLTADCRRQSADKKIIFARAKVLRPSASVERAK